MKTLYEIISTHKTIISDGKGVESAGWKLSMGEYIKAMRQVYQQLRKIFTEDGLQLALGMRAVDAAFGRCKDYFDHQCKFKLSYYIICYERDDLYNAEQEFFGYIRIELLKICEKREEKIAVNRFCLNQFTPTFKRICQ